MNLSMSLKLLLSCFIGAGILLQTACNDGGKFGKYENKKILKEHQRCLAQQNPSRTRALACGNYEKECLRRKKNGNNVCAM